MGSGAKIALVALLILMVVAVAKFVQNGSEEGSTAAGAKKDGPRVATAPIMKPAGPKISNRQYTPVIPKTSRIPANPPPSPPGPVTAQKNQVDPPAMTPSLAPPVNPASPPVTQPPRTPPGTEPLQIAKLEEIEKKANEAPKSGIVQGKVLPGREPVTYLDPGIAPPVGEQAKKQVPEAPPPVIPPAPPVIVPAQPAYPISHKVAVGESWWKIAEKYYGSGKHWKTIQDANGGGTLVLAGKTIKVPAPPAEPAPGPAPPPTAVVRDTNEAFDYLVQKGDTLSSLSKRFGRKVSEIQAANNLEFETLYAGRKIRIPKK